MLSTLLFFACAACVLVAQLFILRASLAGPKVARGDAHVPQPRRVAELTWAVLPAIGLAVVLWMTWREIRSEAVAPPPPGAHDAHAARES